MKIQEFTEVIIFVILTQKLQFRHENENYKISRN